LSIKDLSKSIILFIPKKRTSVRRESEEEENGGLIAEAAVLDN
jgi:hypothetical protein